jgi:hypothetical protein
LSSTCTTRCKAKAGAPFMARSAASKGQVIRLALFCFCGLGLRS